MIPRPEYPRPQFERTEWINLNGSWSFCFDFGKSGMDRELYLSKGFDREIIVPFCPESILSGVGYKDFIESMWYHKKISIPRAWANKKILLHFGGVDYECEAFIDGKSVGRHWGGSTSFYFDITRFVRAGESHNLVLYVFDDTRSGRQAGGKQSPEYSFKKKRCHYTRTTGIWQTVWLEAVHSQGLKSCQIIPDVDNSRLTIIPKFFSQAKGKRLRIRLFEEGRKVSEINEYVSDGMPLYIPVENPHLWEPGKPYLYDLEFTVLAKEGEIIDSVRSYCGMRKILWEGNRLYINDKPVYLRFVLDQGFYPDGIWTAPSDEDLKRDIILAIQAGFNGARLHQKVFEERYHYWADKLGFLTWGETPSWGLHVTEEISARNILSEWREILERDRNHPSIIAWTPLNETRFIEPNPKQHNRLHVDLYDLAKALDPTRPVNDASGYIHVKTDLWTVHLYTQSPEELFELLKPNQEKGVFRNFPEWEPPYENQPYLVDEYGGILWIPDEKLKFMNTSWGYGKNPQTIEEFYARLEGLTRAILSNSHICGYCYTQLTDVEQEQNGIYNFDRTEKFDMNRIRKVFGQVPEAYI